MIFNSIDFLFFLPIVFLLYWAVSKYGFHKQNIVLLFSSYVFYGWWDYRFLGLILLSTIVDYIFGLLIHKTKDNSSRKFYLYFSLLFNLGLLFVFKYFNFFIDTLLDLYSVFGFSKESSWTLNVILPVGISFYTFQTMSYTIDIYKKQLIPTTNFISFATFVSFFPQLVAGPIERASNFLPQILKSRNFSYKQGIDGMRLILFGMFKKVVIADTLAPYVNDIFNNYEFYGGGTLWLGAVFFAFQIYCDFSGYSNIARGIAKLFGIELMVNFSFPYLSRNIGEFWKKWHISLSTWFRDYLYIPLGGSRLGNWGSLRNIFVIFIVSGFWHGANLTFIFWGFIHALLYVPSFILKSNRKHLNSVVAENSIFPSIREIFQIFKTFISVTLAWVFFRADNITIAFEYIYKMFSDFSNIDFFVKPILLVTLMYSIDYLIFKQKKTLPYKQKIYFIDGLLFIYLIFRILNQDSLTQFIYFQF